jgi:hypothetical protein
MIRDSFLASIDPGGHKKGCSMVLFRNATLERVSPSITFRTFSNPHADMVVIERPQVDGRSRAVPPEVMIDMTAEGMLLAGMFVGTGSMLRMLTPSEWKGGVRADGRFIGGLSKATHHANMIESGALSEVELSTIACEFGHSVEGAAWVRRTVLDARRKEALARGASHRNGHYSEARDVARLPDVLDAVGLGLFALGRIDKDGKRK